MNPRKIISLSTCLGMLLSPIITLANHSMPYSEIGQRLVKSYGPVSSETNLPTDKDEKTIDLGVKKLSDQEKRNLLFQVLGESDTHTASPIIRNLIDDLEIFYSSNPENHSDHVFNQLDRTITSFGQAELAAMIANPTSDLATLHQRQNIVQMLIANPELQNELESILKKLKKSEDAIFSFWQEENKVTHDLMNGLFFKRSIFKKLNNNSLALELSTRLGNCGTLFQLFGEYPLFIGMHYIMHKKIRDFFVGLANKKFPGLVVDGKIIDTITQNADIPSEDLDLLKSLLQPTAFKNSFRVVNQFLWSFIKGLNPKNVYNGFKQISELKTKSQRNIVYSFYTLVQLIKYSATGLRVYNNYKALKDAHQTKNVTNYIHTKTNGFAHLVHAMDAIDQLDGFTTLQALHEAQTNPEEKFETIEKLIKLLQTRTFKGNPSFFSLTGRVLAAHTAIENNKEDLVPLMTHLGKIDAFLSLAKLVQEFQEKRVKYSFAEYNTSSDTPAIELNNFWNPIVNPEVVVTNDLSLGKNNAHNIVLTGSNTGGKSTLLKAIMTNLLLAHTVGIVPAESARITPLAQLGTSLNIVDSTAEGKSLYQAEADRAASLIKAATITEQNNGFGFMIIDELFRGTSPEQASIETHRWAKAIEQYPNTLCIIATHFAKPTDLEQETDGYWKNYKMEASVNEDGTIERTFKITEGINESNIAANIAQNAMNSLNNNSLGQA